MDEVTPVLWIAWNSDKKVPYPFMAPLGFSMAQACAAAEEIYRTDSFVTVQTAFTPFPEKQCVKVNDISSLKCCCNRTPHWVVRDDIDGETLNKFLWLECECGMRTIHKEVTYNRERHEQELIEIFNNYVNAK